MLSVIWSTANIDLKKAVQAQITFNTREKFEWNTEDWRVAKKDIRKRLNEILFKLNNQEKIIIKYLNDNPLKDEDGNLIEKIDLLRFVKYASKRRTIDDKFTTDVIKKMPNSNLENNWLTSLLKQHLEEYENLPALAFKGEGLEQLYKKAPYPINKVTVMDGEAKNKIALRNYLLGCSSWIGSPFAKRSMQFKKLGVLYFLSIFVSSVFS